MAMVGFIEKSSNRINSSEYGIDIKDDIWIFQCERDFYALDLNSQATLWKTKRSEGDGRRSTVQIVGDRYYSSFVYYDDTLDIPALIHGSIFNSAIDSIVSPPIDPIQYFLYAFGQLDEVMVYEEEGDLFAFLPFIEYVDIYSSKAFNYVASYNITKKEYDFKKTQLGDTVDALPYSQRPCMYGDIMIVNPHENLYGINKHSGEVIWHRYRFVGSGSGIFKYIIEDDKLFAVNKIGDIQRVMALNPKTGHTIWSVQQGDGNAEVLHYVDGVLYFVDRGSGKLNAFDGETGKQLWEMESVSYSGFKSYGGMRVVPGTMLEKGKVIVSTQDGNVYCYEAAK